MEIANGLILAVRYQLSNSQPQRYNSLPLQRGGNTGLPPAYTLPEQYQRPGEPERAYSPNPVEYGHVESYTPIPK